MADEERIELNPFLGDHSTEESKSPCLYSCIVFVFAVPSYVLLSGLFKFKKSDLGIKEFKLIYN